jgi:hypothetical protein
MNKNSFTINPSRPNLPIVTHLIGAYKLWHGFIPHIPKDSRYTLGSKIDNLFIETSESVFIASYLGKDQKAPYIQKAAARLDLLKFFLQILWEIGALDIKKYIAISEKLDEIGRMLGGWLRQTTNRNPSAGHR